MNARLCAVANITSFYWSAGVPPALADGRGEQGARGRQSFWLMRR
jgi:hypothetical protein